MPMQNIFDNPAFSLSSLTAAVNVIPNQYGRYQQLGLFPESGVRTTTVMVEHQNGVLNLLPTVPRGGPPSVGNVGKRELRAFTIPHIPHNDHVMPEEVQNIRGFGSESEMDALMGVLNEKLMVMSSKHDITRERLMASVLHKGQVLDADNTVLLDYFQAFGISQQSYTIDFDPTNIPATNNARQSAATLLRFMQDNLLGETMTNIRVFCSATFWDAFINDALVKQAWDLFQDRSWYRQDPLMPFSLWGIEWEEYRGTATDAALVARPFITAGEAVAIPMGTQNCFKMVYAPADFNETANTLGRRMYAKQREREFERGWDLHTQSNPLPLCTRPKLLVRLVAG